MGLFDGSDEEPKSKLRRYLVTSLIFAVLVAVGLWYVFRFYPEKKAVADFLDAVVAGNFEKARDIWKPVSTYTYEDFLGDWGPDGYYGPVKSYEIVTAQSPRGGGSGVIVVVNVSPDQPFPAENDIAKNQRLKEVRLWVERGDKSISFAP